MTRFIGLSGTIMRKSLKDFAHILRWCLKDGAPVPRTDYELDAWALALDQNVNEFERKSPGALSVFCGGCESLEGVRQGFRRRLVETPGVVSTIGTGEDVDCALYIHALQYDVKPITNKHFYKLRKDFLTPDGWQLMYAPEVWLRAKELALGFHQVWTPRPPDDWRAARKAWNAFVREVLSRSRTLDSPLQVANACDAGLLDNTLLKEWRKVEPTYTIKTEAIWHDDSALKVCLEWMHDRDAGPGVVWVEFREFGQRLAELSGCKYYGAKGIAADGSSVLDADPDESAILSLDANKEGKNLQDKWSRCLFTSFDGADVLQQAIGRFHRPGQKADEVEVYILLGCKEHANAWRNAWDQAQVVRDTTGAVFKALGAEIDWPEDDEIEAFSGARWGLDEATEGDKQ